MKQLLPLMAIGCLALSSFQSSEASAWNKLGFDLPIVDLDARSEMQVQVDKEKGQYLGHPTTHLLDDGKSILCVYPKGHGRGPIVYKKSFDGGKTWSKRLATPKSWDTSKEVPTLYPVVDASGEKRIIMFSGGQDHNLSPVRMAVSEDDGGSWSELKEIGKFPGIVAMADCIALKEAGHYLATLHIRGPKKTMILQTVKSSDGGLSWSEPKVIYQSASIHLCEAGLVRSPDGEEIAMLLRENARNQNSQIMFSRDEGGTWTEPKCMPGALCGDRHQAIYLPDGRLLIQFRDRTPQNRKGQQPSPTEGDWVGWVGSYDDLKNGREGQYRIRFKDNKHGWDTCYPAAELLPDGTLVCTTYGHWDKGEKPWILSMSFTIDKLDTLAKEIKESGQTPVHNDMGKSTKVYDPDNPRLINQANQ